MCISFSFYHQREATHFPQFPSPDHLGPLWDGIMSFSSLKDGPVFPLLKEVTKCLTISEQ